MDEISNSETAPTTTNPVVTELCGRWENRGKCTFGSECRFLHREGAGPPSTPCRSWLKKGRCTKHDTDNSCPYLHDPALKSDKPFTVSPVKQVAVWECPDTEFRKLCLETLATVVLTPPTPISPEDLTIAAKILCTHCPAFTGITDLDFYRNVCECFVHPDSLWNHLRTLPALFALKRVERIRPEDLCVVPCQGETLRDCQAALCIDMYNEATGTYAVRQKQEGRINMKRGHETEDIWLPNDVDHLSALEEEVLNRLHIMDLAPHILHCRKRLNQHGAAACIEECIRGNTPALFFLRNVNVSDTCSGYRLGELDGVLWDARSDLVLACMELKLNPAEIGNAYRQGEKLIHGLEKAKQSHGIFAIDSDGINKSLQPLGLKSFELFFDPKQAERRWIAVTARSPPRLTLCCPGAVATNVIEKLCELLVRCSYDESQPFMTDNNQRAVHEVLQYCRGDLDGLSKEIKKLCVRRCPGWPTPQTILQNLQEGRAELILL